MDVKDFTPNDLQVKVVENRVLVDGKYERVKNLFFNLTKILFLSSFFLVVWRNKRKKKNMFFLNLNSFQVSEDGMSRSSKSFHKEFTLPSTADIEQISTALSKDGVLTIKVPKRVSRPTIIPV